MKKGRERGTMGKSSCYYTVCVELSAAGSVGIKFMFILFILYSWCSIVELSAAGSVGIMDCSIHWMAVESRATDVG